MKTDCVRNVQEKRVGRRPFALSPVAHLPQGRFVFEWRAYDCRLLSLVSA